MDHKQEIGDNTRVEPALRKGEERFRALFEASPDGILIANPDCAIIRANSSACALFDRSEEELRTTGRDELADTDDPRLTELLRRQSRTDVVRGELNLKRKDGTVFPAEVTVAPLKAGGGSEKLSLFVRDISEAKRVETEREALITLLEAKNAELERFTYTVSHDLRAPLITISSFVGLMRRDLDDGKISSLKDDLARVSGAAEKMMDLLTGLLEISRVGRKTRPPERIPFNDLVGEALELTAGLLERSRAEVFVQPGMPEVFVDRRGVVEVIQNLVENSVKFAGEGKPCIEIGLLQTNEHDAFYVRDDGVGINPSYTEKVFGLFDQLDPCATGTGLGLALAKGIIERHGGTIWAESEGEGRGSTFFFTLPEPAGVPHV